MSADQATTTLIIGAKDHGKTDYVKGNPVHNLPGFIKPKLLLGMKVLIIDTVDHPSYRDIPVLTKEQLPYWQKGVYRMWVDADDMPEIYEILNHNDNTNLWNTFVIWEDAYKHCELKLHKKLKRLIIDSKNKGIEMIFLYHAWGWVPKDFFKVIQYIQLFKTGDSVYDRSDCMPGYFHVAEKAYLEVLKSKNKYVNKLIVTGI